MIIDLEDIATLHESDNANKALVVLKHNNQNEVNC